MKKKLSGKEKAAVFIMALGSEISSSVCSHLCSEDQEILSYEIAARRITGACSVKSVLSEFRNLMKAGNLTVIGGIDYAGSVLKRTMGLEKAEEIISRISLFMHRKPFDSIRKVAPDSLLALLKGEHPQTIAVVLANVEPEKASSILARLPREIQSDVAKRIAVLDRTEPETLLRIEKIIERKHAMASAAGEYRGGIESIIEILNHMDRSSGDNIISTILREDSLLSARLREKNLSFDDIALLDNPSVIRIIRETDPVEIEKALRTADYRVREKIMNNLSSEVSEKVRNNEGRPILIADIEAAQNRITGLLKKLMEQGEIAFA